MATQSNAFLTGIPANSAIIGIGEHTKGIVLQVRERHSAGAASLHGHFRYVHGDVETVVCEHLPLGTRTKKNIAAALSNASKKSFENVRESILNLIGVEHNAALLNTHLFNPAEWAVVAN